MLKQAKAGYPNSKKGKKMKYEFELSQLKKKKNTPIKITTAIITILTIIKSH